jgi:hypothetical protein
MHCVSGRTIKSGGSYMTKEGYAKLTLILSLVAAALPGILDQRG